MPMKVECKNFTFVSKHVFIRPTQPEVEFGLSEVEVYEVGCHIQNGRCGDKKCTEVLNKDKAKIIECVELNDNVTLEEPDCRCFRRVSKFEYIHNEYGLTYKECGDICQNKSYKLTVVKAGLECACLNKLVAHDETTIEECLRSQYDTYLVYDKCSEENNCCPSAGIVLKSATATQNAIYAVIGSINALAFLGAIAAAVILKRKKGNKDDVSSTDTKD